MNKLQYFKEMFVKKWFPNLESIVYGNTTSWPNIVGKFHTNDGKITDQFTLSDT